MGFSGVRVGVKDFVSQKNLYPHQGYSGLVAGFSESPFEK